MTDDAIDMVILIAVILIAIPFLSWGVSSMLKSDIGGFGTFKDKSIENSKYMDVSQSNPDNVPHTIQLDDILLMIGVVDDTMPEPARFRFNKPGESIELNVRLDIVPNREYTIRRISTFYGADATQTFNIELNSIDELWEITPN